MATIKKNKKCFKTTKKTAQKRVLHHNCHGCILSRVFLKVETQQVIQPQNSVGCFQYGDTYSPVFILILLIGFGYHKSLSFLLYQSCYLYGDLGCNLCGRSVKSCAIFLSRIGQCGSSLTCMYCTVLCTRDYSEAK